MCSIFILVDGEETVHPDGALNNPCCHCLQSTGEVKPCPGWCPVGPLHKLHVTGSRGHGVYVEVTGPKGTTPMSVNAQVSGTRTRHPPGSRIPSLHALLCVSISCCLSSCFFPCLCVNFLFPSICLLFLPSSLFLPSNLCFVLFCFLWGMGSSVPRHTEVLRLGINLSHSSDNAESLTGGPPGNSSTDYYPNVKRNEVLDHATTWMNLQRLY